MNTLLLRWPALASEAYHWLELDGQGQRLADGQCAAEQWPELAERARGRRLHIVISAQRALITSVLVPTKQQRHLQRVLPFLIEDVVTSAIDDLHIVAGRKIDAERYQVIAIAHDEIVAIQQQLHAAHLQADRITIDALCLPIRQESQLLIESNHSLLSLPDGSVQQLPNDSLANLLPILIGDSAVSCHRSDSRVAVTFTDAVDDVDNALAFLAQQIENAPNLLQGPYVVKQSISGQFGLWKWPAIMVGAAMFTHYAYALGDWIVLKQRHTQLQNQMRQVYSQAFPGSNSTTPYSDIKKQMKALEGGGSSFLSNLEMVSAVISNSASRITAINFDADRGDLKLNINADDFAALNALQSELKSAGANAELGQAAASEEGVSGTLTLHEGKKK